MTEGVMVCGGKLHRLPAIFLMKDKHMKHFSGYYFDVRNHIASIFRIFIQLLPSARWGVDNATSHAREKV